MWSIAERLSAHLFFLFPRGTVPGLANWRRRLRLVVAGA
jgi:hypothetical protein